MAEAGRRSASHGLVMSLAADIEAVIAEAEPMRVADAVAARLRPFLDRPGLLRPEDQVAQAETYARNLLHVDPVGRFSVWAMVWGPGQGSPVHDHHCWCVMGVHRGLLTEETYRTADAGDQAAPAGRVTCARGAVRALIPGFGDIHRVFNPGSAAAISIHVYGFDPAIACSSVGRIYSVAAPLDAGACRVPQHA